MRKKALSNGDIVFELSEKETSVVKANIKNYKVLRKDTIPDLIYHGAPSVLIMYKTDDEKLLFDNAGVEYLILLSEKTYSYLLDRYTNYQVIHSLDFMEQSECQKFISEIEESVISFCSRNNISINQLSINNIKNEILTRGINPSLFREQISVMCYLECRKGAQIKCVETLPDVFVSIILISEMGKEINPVLFVTKIYEQLFFKN